MNFFRTTLQTSGTYREDAALRARVYCSKLPPSTFTLHFSFDSYPTRVMTAGLPRIEASPRTSGATDLSIGKTKVHDLFSVLRRKYWSIPRRVLEYFHRSTLTTPLFAPPLPFSRKKDGESFVQEREMFEKHRNFFFVPSSPRKTVPPKK